jgi:hypothetical protein
MNTRTQLLESIRPEVKVKTDSSSELEMFQSKTLRPILKFQNELLLAIFSKHLEENKIQFNMLRYDKKEEMIHTALKKDLSLKNELRGLIAGYFTLDEFTFYVCNKSQINKRILEMIIKRITDQKEKL